MAPVFQTRRHLRVTCLALPAAIFCLSPALAGDFINNPERTITQFDPLGNTLGPPITFQNSYIKLLENGQQVVPPKNRLSSTPYNLTWNTELDQELTPRLVVRLSYLGSRTFNIFVVDPLLQPGIRPTMLLSNSGHARYNEFESTVRFRASGQTDLNVSYVWSSARGDLNTLTSIFVPFEQPVIRPDFFGDQPSNVPQRLITWARIRIPWRVTLGPALDVHGLGLAELPHLALAAGRGGDGAQVLEQVAGVVTEVRVQHRG